MIAVTLVAVLVRAPLLGSSYSAPDTAQYLTVAQSVFHGGWSSNLRPPGYSTLLAVFELLGLNPVSAAVFLQNLIGIALPACVLLAGRRFFSPGVGLIAGFLAAASPLMIAIEQFALSDYLFSVILFAAIVVLAEGVLRMRDRRQPTGMLILAGVLFGLATLFRVNGIYGVVAIPVALLLGGNPWRPALRGAGFSVAALLIVIAPWCIYNLFRFDDLSIASEGGISLYARAVSYPQQPPSADTPEGRLARSVYDTAPVGAPERAVGTTTGLFKALLEQTGRNRLEAASAMEGLAKEVILEHPGLFLETSVQMLGRYQGIYNPRTLTGEANTDEIATTTGYIRALGQDPGSTVGDSQLTRLPWQLAQALTEILFVLSVGGVLILGLPFVGARRSRLASRTFLVAGVLGILGIVATARFELRHGIVFAPLIWILAPAAVLQAGRLLLKLRSSLPWPRTGHATA